MHPGTNHSVTLATALFDVSNCLVIVVTGNPLEPVVEATIPVQSCTTSPVGAFLECPVFVGAV